MRRNAQGAGISRQEIRRNAAELLLQWIQIDLPRQICLCRFPQSPQVRVRMLRLIDEPDVRVRPITAAREENATNDEKMHTNAHSCSSNSEENIGRTICALYSDYPYAGVTSSGIWLLVAGMVTTGYGQGGCGW